MGDELHILRRIVTVDSLRSIGKHSVFFRPLPHRPLHLWHQVLLVHLWQDPPKILRPVKFDTIVVDEAAQAPEPDVVLPSTCATTRVVVVGDHKQLGPVVPERNLCAPYVSVLETPFLERMLKNPRRWEASTMLNMQYRMHPSIRSFPSSQFYDSKLEDSVSIPHRPELNRIWPHENEHRRFIDCQTPQSLGLSPELNRACDAALMENKTSLKNAP
ncbi:NAM7 [Symbiodinium necroappetens]|uniref:NAM7 protein n=1 Tax=Symbiodinium necroappetens TaxID=1628268 RepID=A0A813BZY2_9DINO|nr:NAM7 [Symbiodinium necroappetens]